MVGALLWGALGGLEDFGPLLEGSGTLRDLAALDGPRSFCASGAIVEAGASFLPTPVQVKRVLEL